MSQFLFYLLLVFLPTQLGYHFWPSWAMVLGRRIDFLSPTVYLTDLLIASVLIVWFIDRGRRLAHFHFKPRLKPEKLYPRLLIGIILIIFAAVNIYLAANRLVAIYFWIKALEFGLIGYYVHETKPGAANVIFFLSVGVLYSSLIAIGQFLLQRSIGGPLWLLGERTFSSMSPGIAQFNLCTPTTDTCTLLLRAYATFPHPNVLGGFLAIMLPLVLYQLNRGGRVLTGLNIYYLITAALGSIALILTFSRSAWTAAMVEYGLVQYAFKMRIRHAAPYIAVALVVMLAIAGTFGDQDESVLIRRELNNSALTFVWTSPVVGIGLGNFLVELPGRLVSRQIYFLQPVHNIFLLLLTETGIAGLLFFGWAVYSAMRTKKSIFRYSLFTLLLLGLVDHYPLSLQQGQLLLVLFLSLSLIP